jgi:hypothetical protein
MKSIAIDCPCAWMERGKHGTIPCNMAVPAVPAAEWAAPAAAMQDDDDGCGTFGDDGFTHSSASSLP